MALTRRSLPEGVALIDLGQHRLRGLVEPERLYQLTIAGLPADFPPIRTVHVEPAHLPPRMTSFVGRERRARRARAAARREPPRHPPRSRAGPARRAWPSSSAGDSRPAFPDGVWFVALDAIADPDLVGSSIVAALGLRDVTGRSARERLLDNLADRTLLLVLDNFEQVLAGAGIVGEVLAGAAPTIKAIATSRAPLRLAAEQVFAVGPLPVPGPSDAPTPDDVERVPVRPAVPGSRAASPAVVQAVRAERRAGGRHLSSARWPAPRDRAGRRQGPAARRRRRPRPPGEPAGPAGHRQPRRPCPTADAPGHGRLEPGPARSGRTVAVRRASPSSSGAADPTSSRPSAARTGPPAGMSWTTGRISSTRASYPWPTHHGATRFEMLETIRATAAGPVRRGARPTQPSLDATRWPTWRSPRPLRRRCRDAARHPSLERLAARARQPPGQRALGDRQRRGRGRTPAGDGTDAVLEPARRARGRTVDDRGRPLRSREPTRRVTFGCGRSRPPAPWPTTRGGRTRQRATTRRSSTWHASSTTRSGSPTPCSTCRSRWIPTTGPRSPG